MEVPQQVVKFGIAGVGAALLFAFAVPYISNITKSNLLTGAVLLVAGILVISFNGDVAKTAGAALAVAGGLTLGQEGLAMITARANK